MIRNVTIGLLFAVCFCLFFFLFKKQEGIKTAYVDTLFLIENSKLRTKYKAELETKMKISKIKLDSLYYLVNNSKDKTDDLKRLFLEKKQELEREYLETEKNYDAKISNQITEFTLEYGKEKGYDYIFGANGQGSLMFAKEKNNISKEVLEYINKKYEGD